MSQNDPNQISMERIKALIASPAGQKLMTMVQKANPKDLEVAKVSAQKGDLAAAKESLRELLNDPKIQALLKDFGA